jgi:hypothetical protein
MKKFRCNNITQMALLSGIFMLIAVFDSQCGLSPQELIQNGDFSKGDINFESDYIKSHFDLYDIKQPGYYIITSDPHSCYYTFGKLTSHSPGDTLMLLANGNLNSDKACWRQTLKSLPHNADFQLSFWYASVDPLNPAKIAVKINGNLLTGTPVQFPWDSCIWYNSICTWNSGNSDIARIEFINTNLSYYGNDFVLDDISFKQNCSINVDLKKKYDICLGDSGKIVYNQKVQGVDPISFKWIPTNGLSNPNIADPTFSPKVSTRYYLTANDASDCAFYDSVDVTVNNYPNAKLILDKSSNLCPCDSIVLRVEGGSEYLWDNHETTPSITVKSTGKYGVTVSNGSTCTVYLDTLIQKISINPTVVIDTSHTKIGDTLTVLMKIIDDGSRLKCGMKNFTAKISFNSTILTPILPTPRGIKENGALNKEFLNITGNAEDSIAYKFTFFVTLGNDSTAKVNIEEFKFDCSDVQPIIKNGNIIIDDLCKAPSPRLFDSSIPMTLANSPNPVSSSTEIEISTPEYGRHKLILFNSYGQQIESIFDQIVKPGIIKINYNVSRLSDGIYYFVLQTPDYSLTRKMVIIK